MFLFFSENINDFPMKGIIKASNKWNPVLLQNILERENKSCASILITLMQ